MKKLLIFVFGCLSINMYYSQIESKRILDSISAENWKKNIPNLDSLAEINLQKIDVKHKDSIILKTDKITAELGTEIPITPFQLIKTKEEKVGISMDRTIWFLTKRVSATGILGEIITLGF